jgi:hypothetical protein
MGIPTSWNPDTLEGLEGQLSVRIHRIPAELPHLIELELRKLCRTQKYSIRASMLELLRGLPTSREVLWPSEPRLSLSTLQRLNLEAPWGRAKPHFPFCWGSTVVFIGGVRRCSGRILGG